MANNEELVRMVDLAEKRLFRIMELKDAIGELVVRNLEERFDSRERKIAWDHAKELIDRAHE